jgi:hypothetical protein
VCRRLRRRSDDRGARREARKEVVATRTGKGEARSREGLDGELLIDLGL